MNWQVYIILCSDDTFYTGITTDLQRRFDQHAAGLGAKYFRSRQPLQFVYQESGHTRSTASRRELEIKTLTRSEKSVLISSIEKQAALSGRFRQNKISPGKLNSRRIRSTWR